MRRSALVKSGEVGILCLALAYLVSAQGAPANSDSLPATIVLAATMPLALRDLQLPLAAIIQRSQPQATLKWDGEELVGQYQTQPFQVHSRDMRGYLSPQAYTELGPNYQGFLMRLRLDKTPYVGQSADPFHVWHRTYWDEYINEYPLPDKSGYLRLELAYGSRADSELLQQIKATIAAYATAVARVSIIENKVEIKSGAGAYSVVAAGAALVAGDFVKTGKRSKVDIKFVDGSMLRLGQNAEAKISASYNIQVLSGEGMLVTVRPVRIFDPAISSTVNSPPTGNKVEILTKDGAKPLIDKPPKVEP